MHQSLIIIALLVTACGGCYQHTRPKVFSPMEQIAASVGISVICPIELSASAGSGVFIDGETVLTAYHVVDCRDAIVTVTRGGKSIPARISKVDPAGDVAALTLVVGIEGIDRPVIGKRPDIDHKVCLQPRVPTNVRSCGWVAEHYEKQIAGDVRMNTTFTWYGNSGSGVWNEHGALIGIVIYLAAGQNGQIIGGRFTSLDSRRWLL